MNRDIFEEMKTIACCVYISDLKYLDKKIVDIFQKIKWKEYDAAAIKSLMCYLYESGRDDIIK